MLSKGQDLHKSRVQVTYFRAFAGGDKRRQSEHSSNALHVSSRNCTSCSGDSRVLRSGSPHVEICFEHCIVHTSTVANTITNSSNPSIPSLNTIAHSNQDPRLLFRSRIYSSDRPFPSFLSFSLLSLVISLCVTASFPRDICTFSWPPSCRLIFTNRDSSSYSTN